MKVKELMTSPAETCDAGDDLAMAAMIMWRKDCGIVPVIDDRQELRGVITDRDICIAAATRHRRPGEISVREVMSGPAQAVRPEDDVRLALETMRTERVRRLPVVDAKNRLRGVISLNDVILRALPATTSMDPEVSANDILMTLQSISTHGEAEAPRAVADGRGGRR